MRKIYTTVVKPPRFHSAGHGGIVDVIESIYQERDRPAIGATSNPGVQWIMASPYIPAASLSFVDDQFRSTCWFDCRLMWSRSRAKNFSAVSNKLHTNQWIAQCFFSVDTLRLGSATVGHGMWFMQPIQEAIHNNVLLWRQLGFWVRTLAIISIILVKTEKYNKLISSGCELYSNCGRPIRYYRLSDLRLNVTKMCSGVAMLWGAQVQQWGRDPKAHCSGIAQKAYGFESLHVEWVVALCGMLINLVLQRQN